MKKLFLIAFCIGFFVNAQVLHKAIDLSTLTKAQKKGFKFEEDKFNNAVFITRNQAHLYNVYPYIVVSDGYAFMRFVVSYNRSNWIFFDKVTFLIDGEKVEYIPKSVSTNMTRTGISEISDEATDEFIENLIYQLANSENTEFRLSGKRTFDKKLSSYDYKVIRETVKLFDIIIQKEQN